MNAEQAQVPDHWGWIPVAELSERLAKGRSPKYGDNGPLVIKTRHVYPRGFPEALSQRSTANYQPEQFVRPNDLLMTAMGRGSIGRLLLVSESAEPMVTDGCILSIRSKSWISPQWLYYFLQSSHGQREILARETGTAYAKNRGRTQVKPADFGTIQVPIPFPDHRQRSIQEQRRIVARIEALFDRMEEARRLRIAAGEDAERLMLAMLAEAFSGKDTERWTTQTIAEIGEVKGGKRLPKGESFAAQQTSYPYLRVVDFSNNTIDRSDLRYLTPEIHARISRYTISKDDVYISIAGTIGVVGTVPDDLDGSNLTENAAKIVFREEARHTIDKRYLVYFLQSPLGRSQIDERSKAAGQPKLALMRIRTIEISYPPLPEQRRIIEYLDGVQAQVAELKRLQAASAAELGRLSGAVLARAFRGEL